ncbi:hypothetical protein [Streptomyces sp. NPDC053367]|uniref:hypothetical protein n=1 Tax=Streptomyces sp. NPDC053367 TaxID=3365700 RepID=UPI0037D22602
MTAHRLGPTRFLTRGERLLHGKGVASATGTGQAEEWVDLDRQIWSGTATSVKGRRISCRIRIGFHWFDKREYADWGRAPYRQQCGTPSWSAPPTESEIALCLAHADARVRAAALAHVQSAVAPASVLPLVLIRCADADERVRDLAREILGRALADADEAVLRRLSPLAALVGMRRRYGAWVREAVLGRLGGPDEEAVAQLLSGSAPETRIAGLLAGAAYGRLGQAEIWAVAGSDPACGVRRHAACTGIRVTLASGQRAHLDDVRARVVACLEAEPSSDVRRAVLAAAVAAGCLRAPDWVSLARGHRDRGIRRYSCAAALAGPEGDTVLDSLLSAQDAAVRSAAVGRLRGAGRGAELVRHLPDRSVAVRAAACRELRAMGDDPRAHYRALCADPATVTPAALIGLAEQRCREDGALLRSHTRHPHAQVRARAVSALRMLGALPDDVQPAPEPRDVR